MKEIQLTKEQQSIIRHTEGYLGVTAVPGSGKTTVIEYKILYLLGILGLPDMNPNPIQLEDICVVTFTTEAASKLESDLKLLLKRYHYNVNQEIGFVGTFHSLCHRIIRSVDHIIELDILSEQDGIKILHKIRNEQDGDKKHKKIYFEEELQELFNMIRRKKQVSHQHQTENYVEVFLREDAKNWMRTHLYEAETEEEWYFWRYLQQQCKQHKKDYEDLLNLGLYYLDKYPKVSVEWKNKYRYILCDEFQDVNEQQNRLLSLLSEGYKSMTVVGDANQNIYTWRGANNQYIKNYCHTYVHMLLSKNYRSTQQIISLAECIIMNNHQNEEMMPIQVACEDGFKPVFTIHENARQEAEWILQKILQLNRDTGILVRNRRQANMIQKVFGECEQLQKQVIKDIKSKVIARYQMNEVEIKLMTIHQAKGMEFEVVFIPGMIDGEFPVYVEENVKAAYEEERRLFYVAITRAKRYLFISFYNKRKTRKSRLLAEIEPELLAFED